MQTRLSTRACIFDIQFFYFAHDTPREMGGTMILPGSHYRRVCESDIARYQNFLEQAACCMQSWYDLSRSSRYLALCPAQFD